LALLGAAAAGGDLTVDRCVVGTIVAGIEKDDAAGDIRRRRGTRAANVVAKGLNPTIVGTAAA
jgi:hypothetical protein